MSRAGKSSQSLQAEAEILRLQILQLNHKRVAKLQQAGAAAKEEKRHERVSALQAVSSKGGGLLQRCNAILHEIGEHSERMLLNDFASQLDTRLQTLRAEVEGWRGEAVSELCSAVVGELGRGEPIYALQAKLARLNRQGAVFLRTMPKPTVKQSSGCERFLFSMTCGLFGKPAVDLPGGDALLMSDGGSPSPKR